MIWAVIGFFTLIVLIDFVPLVKKRKWFAVSAFVCVFSAALTFAILHAFKVNVPSILIITGNFMRWIGLSYSP